MTVTWNDNPLRALLTGGMAQAVNYAAEMLRADSVPLAPRDTGMLRNSAQVTPATPDNLTAHVSYNTPYAVRQHEELDWRHEEGQAKYLEEPVVRRAKNYQRAIANRIRRSFPR